MKKWLALALLLPCLSAYAAPQIKCTSEVNQSVLTIDFGTMEMKSGEDQYRLLSAENQLPERFQDSVFYDLDGRPWEAYFIMPSDALNTNPISFKGTMYYYDYKDPWNKIDAGKREWEEPLESFNCVAQ